MPEPIARRTLATLLGMAAAFPMPDLGERKLGKVHRTDTTPKEKRARNCARKNRKRNARK